MAEFMINKNEEENKKKKDFYKQEIKKIEKDEAAKLKKEKAQGLIFFRYMSKFWADELKKHVASDDFDGFVTRNTDRKLFNLELKIEQQKEVINEPIIETDEDDDDGKGGGIFKSLKN